MRNRWCRRQTRFVVGDCDGSATREQMLCRSPASCWGRRIPRQRFVYGLWLFACWIPVLRPE